MSSIPEILDEAAKVIEARGWWQGGFTPDGTRANPVDFTTCPVCVLAAINVATGNKPDAVIEAASSDGFDAAVRFGDFLGYEDDLSDGKEIGAVIGDIWNDQVAESAEQVTAALRECAAELTKAGA